MFFLGPSPCTSVHIWLSDSDLACYWLKLFCWLSRWPRWPSQSDMSQSPPTENVLFLAGEGLWSRRSLILPHPGRKRAEKVQVEAAGSGGIADCVSSLPKRSLCFCLMTQQLVSWAASWRGFESLSQKPSYTKEMLCSGNQQWLHEKILKEHEVT